MAADCGGIHVRGQRGLASGISEESLTAVGRRLSEASQQPGFLPEAELQSMHGSDSMYAGMYLQFGIPYVRVDRARSHRLDIALRLDSTSASQNEA
jgi:hypothetical protein